MDLLNSTGIARLHICIYSYIHGTPNISQPMYVGWEVIRWEEIARVEKLMMLANGNRRLREVLSPAAGIAARRGSTTVADALTTSLTHTHTRTRREGLRVAPPNVATFSVFFVTLICTVWSAIPATSVHAASCPPKARERFLRNVATDSLAAPWTQHGSGSPPFLRCS